MKRKLIIIVLFIAAVIFILFGILLIEFLSIANITNGDKISDYSNPKKALLIIDLQRNITEKNGKMILNLEQSGQTIINVNKIIDQSVRLGLDVIYITNEWKKKSIVNIATKRILEEGSDMAKMDPRVKDINNNHFIKYEMDSFSNKDFEKYLFDNQINQLYITGLDASACVDRTVKAALNRDYKVYIVKDAIVAKNEGKRIKKINEFRNLGAEIIETEDIIK